MSLPELEFDFSHAVINDVTLGPRREVTLTVQTLSFVGSVGRRSPGIKVRFGGIINFESVESFFAQGPHLGSELAWLRYDESRTSRPGRLFLDLAFERIEARIILECAAV